MIDSIEVVLAAFRAVQARDEQALAKLSDPHIEFHWPDSLPYGGSRPGAAVLPGPVPSWSETWDPLQGAAERKMDPRVVAASQSEVVVLWLQRGRSADGQRFEMPVLGLYGVGDGKLARAQMFYFDTVPVLAFLRTAARP